MNSPSVSQVRVLNPKHPGLIRQLFASGVLSAIATARLVAADPQLSSVGISPKGNLSFKVTGTAGASALIESSPNLTEWAAIGSVVLTNGAAGFFLPPGDDFAFLRTQIVDPASLPSAPAITPKVNQDFVKNRFESGDGQTLKILDDAGYTYQVVITEDALAAAKVLKFEVVNQAAGFPAGWTYLTGIQISPAPVSLLGDSALTITAPATVALGTIAVVAWDGAGKEVHLVPFSTTNSQVVIPLNHLGGFGLCKIAGTPSGSIAASHPTDSIAWLEQQIALAQLQGKLVERHPDSPLVGHGGSSKRPTQDTLGAQAMARIMVTSATYHLRSALSSDDSLELGLREYNAMKSLLDHFLANPENTDLAQLVQDTDTLALQALIGSFDRAFSRCQAGNIKALVRMYRDIRWTHEGRVSQLISLAQRDHFRDLLSRATRFKLEMLSSTAYNIASGSVLTSVSAEFMIGVSVADFENHVGRITGTATTTIDSTSWIQPPAGCSAQSSPVTGTGAVFDLQFTGVDGDIDTHIVSGDEDIQIPQAVLQWDPFTAAPVEEYVLTCDGRSIAQPGSFWGAAFGSLHKSEIQIAPTGRQVLLVDTFNYEGRGVYHKEYLQTGSVGSGSASETTNLRLTFLGVEN